MLRKLLKRLQPDSPPRLQAASASEQEIHEERKSAFDRNCLAANFLWNYFLEVSAANIRLRSTLSHEIEVRLMKTEVNQYYRGDQQVASPEGWICMPPGLSFFAMRWWQSLRVQDLKWLSVTPINPKVRLRHLVFNEICSRCILARPISPETRQMAHSEPRRPIVISNGILQLLKYICSFLTCRD